MHRILAIGLVSALILVGALHYAPLWLFVLVIPIWMVYYLDSETRRVRAETIQRIRAQLLRPGDDEQG